ncbi:ferredoxin [Nitriliruptoraceae bacterium ZYF776]|nr:ferredoxin [Profundirhabdus halotolerans]
MVVTIDRALCSGHGRCYALAPEVFAPDDEGFPILEVERVQPGTDAAEDATLGVEVCPEGALALRPATEA